MTLLLSLFVVIAALLAAWIFLGRPVAERLGMLEPLSDTSARGRLVLFFRSSATMAWAWLVQICGAVIAVALMLFQDPELKAQIATFVKPEYMAAALVAIGFITAITRMRTASKE